MKKIKDPVLFEKIRKFLTEDMPVLRKNLTISYNKIRKVQSWQKFCP